MVKSFTWTPAAFCFTLSDTPELVLIWEIKVHASRLRRISVIYGLPLYTPLPEVQKILEELCW